MSMGCLEMFFFEGLEGHDVVAFEGAVDEDQEGAEIFGEGVGGGRTAGEEAEEVVHALLSHHGQIEVGTVDLSDCLLYQRRPKFHTLLSFATVQKEHLFLSCYRLHRHIVINNYKSPNAIFA
jgi:hypothetical protein